MDPFEINLCETQGFKGEEEEEKEGKECIRSHLMTLARVEDNNKMVVVVEGRRGGQDLVKKKRQGTLLLSEVGVQSLISVAEFRREKFIAR
jgi:hypothetical protein